MFKPNFELNFLPFDSIRISSDFVPVEVIFGAPGRACLGAGICKILSIDHVRVRWKCPSAFGYLGKTCEDQLFLIFERKRLTQDVYDRFFKDEFFILEEEYCVPTGLLCLLNMPVYTLKKGRFIVRMTEKCLAIVF